MRLRLCFAGALGLLTAASGAATNLAITERMSAQLPLELSGTLWIDNPIGDIEIIGGNESGLQVTAFKTTVAADPKFLKQAREQTLVSFEGDPNVRVIRTIVPPPPAREGDWDSRVSYIVHVPRTVHVRVGARMARGIHIANIMGNVTVHSITGAITLDNVVGSSIIDTTNGNVVYHYTQKPIGNVEIRAVNADIEIDLPRDSNINWIANTLQGDVLTNLPVRASYEGTSFHGTVNAPGGPTVTTQTLIGNVSVLGNGLDPRNLRSLREVAISETQPHAPEIALLPSRRIQLPIVGGGFDFATSVGDVQIGEIRGPARIQTGAGEIELGLVYGDCAVTSLGGPLDLGDIKGFLVARTRAGDVLVRSAHAGGRISTEGGIIRILYTGGPTTLESGGGDIIVRQAAGPVKADTKSGDVTITADPSQKSQKLEVRTGQGNIILNLHPRFAADIDATVLTDDPQPKTIHADFNGLQIQREQVGNRTRVHAVGKLNGGGERLDLYAEDGDIRINTVATNVQAAVPPLP